MKKIIITSLLILLVPSVLFFPIYFLMMHEIHNAEDNVGELYGQWQAFQYYAGADRVVCDEEHTITVTLDADHLSIEGSVLPAVSADCEWEGQRMIRYEQAGGEAQLFLTLDDEGRLKITTEDPVYTILLRRSEGAQEP